MLARMVAHALGLLAMSDKQDLLIIGGGLVGMALALAAARKGFSSHVVDRADPADLTADGFDGRASAISTALSLVMLLRAGFIQSTTQRDFRRA